MTARGLATATVEVDGTVIVVRLGRTDPTRER